MSNEKLYEQKWQKRERDLLGEALEGFQEPVFGEGECGSLFGSLGDSQEWTSNLNLIPPINTADFIDTSQQTHASSRYPGGPSGVTREVQYHTSF